MFKWVRFFHWVRAQVLDRHNKEVFEKYSRRMDQVAAKCSAERESLVAEYAVRMEDNAHRTEMELVESQQRMNFLLQLMQRGDDD